MTLTFENNITSFRKKPKHKSPFFEVYLLFVWKIRIFSRHEHRTDMDLAETINTININNDLPLNIENFAALIDDHHTEFIICSFTNNTTYIITQFGKVGNLYSVDTEQVENCMVTNEPVYNLRTLLGGDNIEIEAGIRYIAERLNIKKSSLFSLTLKNYKVDHLKLIVEAILNYK